MARAKTKADGHDALSDLHFSVNNSKLAKLAERTGKRVISFSLLSGVACPGADQCKSMAVEDSDGRRRIEDGPRCKFRCFSASQEVVWTSVYKSRKRNWVALQRCNNGVDRIRQVIRSSLADNDGLILGKWMAEDVILRLHVAGDFYSAAYLWAWYETLREFPRLEAYAYTKSIHHVLRLWEHGESRPANLKLIYSVGGRFDYRIEEAKARVGGVAARVVFSQEEAGRLGLQIDEDDFLALRGNRDFALLIHGTQPAKGKSK